MRDKGSAKYYIKRDIADALWFLQRARGNRTIDIQSSTRYENYAFHKIVEMISLLNELG